MVSTILKPWSITITLSDSHPCCQRSKAWEGGGRGVSLSPRRGVSDERQTEIQKDEQNEDPSYCN